MRIDGGCHCGFIAYEGEADPGTRIFLRQLIEMHASNLAVECENMRLVGELCGSLESLVNGDAGFGKEDDA